MTVKLVLSTGKEVKLTEEEYDELLRRRVTEIVPIYPTYPFYPTYPTYPYPYEPYVYSGTGTTKYSKT